jgi:hypothetical protein
MIRTAVTRARRAVSIAAGSFALLSLTSAAEAQRAEARYEWQHREIVLEYGVARLGKHSLDELPVGGEWRLGNNTASTLSTAMPVLAGDAIVPPGAYRVKLVRSAEQAFAITVEGADQGKAGLNLAGDFKSMGKPKDQLAITWSPSEAKADEKQNRAASLIVQFGTYQLTVPALLIGTHGTKVRGWDIDAFTFPAAEVEKRLDGGRAIPVAAFRRSGKHDRKEPDSFNLFVSKSSATLVPAMVAPTESFGFGEIAPPDAAWTRAGTVTWDKAEGNQTYLEIAGVELSKTRDFTCTIKVGGRSGKVTVKDPSAPAAAAR